MNKFVVALVNPRDGTVPDEYFAPCENLALAYLAACLRRNGLRVEIIDGDAERLSNKEVVEKVLSMDANLVGITSLARTIDDALDIANLLKERSPHIHVCLGGQHATYAAEDILTLNTSVDSVVRGEGEQTFSELTDCLLRQKTLAGIDGVYYRDVSGRIIKNRDRKALENLDEIPFPARDVLERLIAGGRSPVLSVLSSRGCFGTCNFCNASSFFNLGGGSPWRGRSPKNVVDELEIVCGRHDADSVDRVVHFYDDNFVGPGILGITRVQEISREILRRDLNIVFSIFCRADSFASAPHALLLLKRAGLITAFVGIESSQESELRLFEKGTTCEQNIATMKLMNRFKIAMPASGFIMFHPYSTYENLRANARFLHTFDHASFWNLSVRLIAYKGNRIVDRLRNDGLLGKSIAHGGIYEYMFVDRRIGVLADAIDFSTHPIMLKADAVIRHTQSVKSYISQKLTDEEIADAGLQVVDDRIRRVFDFSYHFFVDSVDLSENGWNEKIFEEMKERFLVQTDVHVNDLNDAFYACLKRVSDIVDKKESGRCSVEL